MNNKEYTNEDKLDHIFADMVKILTPEMLSYFLSFAYGVFSQMATDSVVETITERSQYYKEHYTKERKDK